MIGELFAGVITYKNWKLLESRHITNDRNRGNKRSRRMTAVTITDANF